MKRRDLERVIRAAQMLVNVEISGHANRGGMAGALASEGYAGGYSDALSDVLLVIADCKPCVRPHYWEQLGSRQQIAGAKQVRSANKKGAGGTSE